MNAPLFLCAALVIATAGPAAADVGRPAGRMAQADSNQDGMITRAEFRTYRATQFDEMDRNQDGFLSDSDLPGFARRGARGDKLRRMIVGFDTSRDGRVDRTEFANGPTLGFDQADADDNDVVDSFELKQMKAGN
ncbi:EF-hand domain-containing protein [Asticcacaulis sp. AC402]|uniref:EF-hand domain-containing protein n=1 Tax=Asticcacaulis sp. AC402 TaxID=1282361 RepID=UPI0003C3B758|nr:EF-hand domain-containing protein [Asticcacaulis sp. AC402]ESQ73989.1 hypothetical protein ABAC402_16620 [Asticcacaulis sp. AC402]